MKYLTIRLDSATNDCKSGARVPRFPDPGVGIVLLINLKPGEFCLKPPGFSGFLKIEFVQINVGLWKSNPHVDESFILGLVE